MQNKTYISWDPEELNQSVSDRFQKVVRAYPDHIAIRDKQASLTYRVLDQVSNQLSRWILSCCELEIEEPIPIIFDHEISALVAIIAILKAGKAYVFLDPSFPEERLKEIVKQLDTRLLITKQKYYAKALQITQGLSIKTLIFEQLDPSLSFEALNLQWSCNRLAIILFTSGSTGKPKGVKRSHLNILRRTFLDNQDYSISNQDTCSLLFTCSFATSVGDIFNALLSGATLSLFSLKQEGLILLADWIDQESITILHLPTEFLRQWLTLNLDPKRLSSVWLLIPSGRLFKSDLERLYRYFSQDCLLHVRLASTETGLMTRWYINYHTNIITSVVPVGYPLPEHDILLLDEKKNPVLAGEIGEIAIRSLYLSPGYWKNPELTAQKFLPGSLEDPRPLYLTGDLGRFQESGCLEFMGRKDFMVKIRGFRVELQEIEAALLDLESISQATVIAQCSHPSNHENLDPRLIAYIVLSQGSSTTVSELRRILSQTLPDYMIPSVLIMLDHLPLTPNGKVDTRALPNPSPQRPELDVPYLPPETPLQTRLAQIWAGILQCDPIGIQDNFFELGGNSLLGTQVMSRIQEEFHLNLPLQTLFDHPTIETWAKEIEGISRFQENSTSIHREEIEI